MSFLSKHIKNALDKITGSNVKEERGEDEYSLFKLLDSLPTEKTLNITKKEREYVRDHLNKLGRRHLNKNNCEIKKAINYIVANLSIDMIEYIKKMYNKRRMEKTDMINHFLPPPPPIS